MTRLGAQAVPLRPDRVIAGIATDRAALAALLHRTACNADFGRG